MMMNRLELLSLVLAGTFLPGESAGVPGYDNLVDTSRVEAVHREFSCVPPEILGLAEPITITEAIASDSSAAMKLTDGLNRTLWVTFDYRARAYDGPTTDWRGANIWMVNHRRLLLNARTIADTSAVNLPLRSPEESALYGFVIRWAAQNKLRTSFPRAFSVAEYTGEVAFHYAVFRLLWAMDVDFCLE